MRSKATGGEASRSDAPTSTPSLSTTRDCLKRSKGCSSGRPTQSDSKRALETEEDRTAMKAEYAALPETLKGSLREYKVVEGANLLSRVDGFFKWQDARRREGYWP